MRLSQRGNILTQEVWAPGSNPGRGRMTDKPVRVKNMPGRNRPELTCDRLGYHPSVGDEEWETKHRRNWKRLPNGVWEKR